MCTVLFNYNQRFVARRLVGHCSVVDVWAASALLAAVRAFSKDIPICSRLCGEAKGMTLSLLGSEGNRASQHSFDASYCIRQLGTNDVTVILSPRLLGPSPDLLMTAAANH